MALLNPKIFKAYDIRGKYPAELDDLAVKTIAEILVKKFSDEILSTSEGKSKRVILGMDGRISSPLIYKSIGDVFQKSGFKVEFLGLCTTPMFYFSANRLKTAGIMITASHAPKDFNGLKVVNKKGEIISGSQIAKWII